MKNLIIVLLAIAVLALTATLGVVLQEPATSTFEIDRDRAAIGADIANTEAESAKYAGGLIKVLLDLRLTILKNSAAMLDQKRYTLLRRISLRYSVDGQAVREASNQELEEILEEMMQAEKKVLASKNEASRYSGGLIQTMALLTAATDELSVSQLRLKFYSAKYGMLLPVPVPESKLPPEKAPGKIVKDREAL